LKIGMLFPFFFGVHGHNQHILYRIFGNFCIVVVIIVRKKSKSLELRKSYTQNRIFNEVSFFGWKYYIFVLLCKAAFG
jgi:hypothetical protein